MIFFFPLLDDAADIEVLSIASSDDYCMVPLPACFNPDIPLNFEDLGQGSSVERPVSLAEEINPLGSAADQQDTTAHEEPESVSIHLTIIHILCGRLYCDSKLCCVV
jgi:hypothetical protein